MTNDETSAPAAAPARLQSGDRCLDFFMKTIDDVILESSDFRGKKVWIALYRYAGCPVCAQHLAEVIEAKAFFESAGISFIAVYDCEAQNVPNWIRKNVTPSLQVVADETQGLHEKFGAQKSWRGLLSPGSAVARLKAAAGGFYEQKMDGSINMMPAHILIDEEGRVAVAHYAKHAGDHVSWKTVREFATMLASEREPVAAPEVPAATEYAAQVVTPIHDLNTTESTDSQITKSSRPQFVVILRWKIRVGSESEFFKTWKGLEEETKSKYAGYIGSRLHIDSDQLIIAYTVWATKNDWERFWITKEQTVPGYLQLNSFIEKQKKEQFLRVLADFVQLQADASRSAGDEDFDKTDPLITANFRK
jgi:thioredoxin-dependent peroxiredoxin